MKAFNALAAAGIGAGLLYFFDPVSGRRRRAVLRDKTVSNAHKFQRSMEIVGKDLHNRLQGIKSGDLSFEKLDLLQTRWAPSTRFLIAMLGTMMLCKEIRRTGLSTSVQDFLSLALILEALTNFSVRQSATTHTAQWQTNRAMHPGEPEVKAAKPVAASPGPAPV